MADEEKVPTNGENVPVEEPEEEPLKVSRRDFLIGAGAGVVATGAVAGGYIALRPREQVEVVEEAEVVSKEAAPGEMLPEALEERLITLNVNGQTHTVSAKARATLADVLRYQLRLTGTRVGCNRAECGACTVVMNGVSVYSCTQMAWASEGYEIVTIEGLATDATSLEGLHPIQRAWAVYDAPQCNFCMSGQMMSAYALLEGEGNLDPTEEEVRQRLSGNICRCGNYPHIVQATLAAAKEMKEA